MTYASRAYATRSMRVMRAICKCPHVVRSIMRTCACEGYKGGNERNKTRDDGRATRNSVSRYNWLSQVQTIVSLVGRHSTSRRAFGMQNSPGICRSGCCTCVSSAKEASANKQNGLKLTIPSISATVETESKSTENSNGNSTSPNTTSTPLSRRHASEDTTLDYAYDNPAMTPSPETAQARTKARESAF
jgi:hypothetical protein